MKLSRMPGWRAWPTVLKCKRMDMRSLGFGDASFDVVVSHWAVHNLSEQADRKVALREMVRVLETGRSGYVGQTSCTMTNMPPS